MCSDGRPIGYNISLAEDTFYNWDENEKIILYLEFNKTFTLPIGDEFSKYIIIEIEGYEDEIDYNIYGLNRRRNLLHNGI